MDTIYPINCTLVSFCIFDILVFLNPSILLVLKPEIQSNKGMTHQEDNHSKIFMHIHSDPMFYCNTSSCSKIMGHCTSHSSKAMEAFHNVTEAHPCANYECGVNFQKIETRGSGDWSFDETVDKICQKGENCPECSNKCLEERIKLFDNIKTQFQLKE